MTEEQAFFILGVLMGGALGGLLAWAVTTWLTSSEPHCLDCECEGCEILRSQA